VKHQFILDDFYLGVPEEVTELYVDSCPLLKDIPDGVSVIYLDSCPLFEDDSDKET
jgi:hypothetical protein